MSLAVSDTVLARGSSVDGPGDWALLIGIIVLYLAIGFGLEYRAKRRRSADQPAKAAARGLFAERDGSAGADPQQYFASRMVMLVGALATGGAGFLTRGAPTAVQALVMGAVAVVAIFAWAYFDYRTESRDET
ncbi:MULTISPECIES: hypothetical protein [unclassified Streptomyces]|uniref:hypothetical protein n=1 Tax=Streptomyces TaxID=1883 RepID=UPI0013685635|nr:MULTISPECIES: hypothetical protein [unclassified Streptomyces]NEA03439.1 hypothetical protein [Streptomyces sp. SID10116]MYY83908.1 hypothetical protein [Streptomyces sp. SID335]MYZ12773.1 hypothetical protein [Streptomyces sp. SID337]NDZ84110.1 hypothetical protein [Streptomyces sp. SID10115]NEA05964.1 hypothetical protein [Streptomyces sp. SID10116]